MVAFGQKAIVRGISLNDCFRLAAAIRQALWSVLSWARSSRSKMRHTQSSESYHRHL